jgi:CRP-like cAMP-binding protein
MHSPPQPLAHLEYLGDAVRYADRLLEVAPHCPLLEVLSGAETRLLARYLDAYRAPAGAEVMRRGALGDFTALIIEGRVAIAREGAVGASPVGPGAVLGEMSLIDGAPRLADCVALEPLLIAVLGRDALARMIVEQPGLGAKLMMHLVLMLARRVRALGKSPGALDFV